MAEKKEIKRIGRIFDLGAPYLAGSNSGYGNLGVCYDFPESDDYEKKQKWKNRIREKRKELSELLIKNLSNYMDKFDINGKGHGIPYPQIAKDGVVLHMGNNGRWFEVYSMLGGFLSFHNIDASSEAVAGFNIGSDTLEFLDDSLLCPRIDLHDNKYKITYPLPNNEKELPVKKVKSLTDPEIFQKWFEIMKLGKAKLKEPFEYEFEEGKIGTEGRFIKGEVSRGWRVHGATFIMAQLSNSFVWGS